MKNWIAEHQELNCHRFPPGSRVVTDRGTGEVEWSWRYDSVTVLLDGHEDEGAQWFENEQVRRIDG